MEAPPLLKKRNRFARGLLVCLAIVLAPLGLSVWSRVPPKEATVIKRFEERRGHFERLKETLHADLQIRCIRSDKVTTKSHAQLPPDRAKPYMALLKDTGGELVLQNGERSNRTFEVYTWTWGWAGLSRDVGISWNEQPPTNQVQVLFGRRPPGSVPGQDVFYKHIDQNWYVRANF